MTFSLGDFVRDNLPQSTDGINSSTPIPRVILCPDATIADVRWECHGIELALAGHERRHRQWVDWSPEILQLSKALL